MIDKPKLGADEQFCSSCGEVIKKAAEVCPKCGVGVQGSLMKSEKGFAPTLILCLLLGVFGIHRFYVRKIGTGILMLLTLGGFGIWQLIDTIRIAMGSFEDSKGNPIMSGH